MDKRISLKVIDDTEVLVQLSSNTRYGPSVPSGTMVSSLPPASGTLPTGRDTIRSDVVAKHVWPHTSTCKKMQKIPTWQETHKEVW